MVHVFSQYILKLLLSDGFIINFHPIGSFLEWKYKEHLNAIFFFSVREFATLNAMKICSHLLILYFSYPR